VVAVTYAERLSELWRSAVAPRLEDAPTVVSCFAGMGGSLLGYLAAGYREVLAIEHDPHAAACLRLNYGVRVHQGDIADVDPAAIGLAPGELDLLDGSPPCQGFSSLGRRAADDPRSVLFLQFVRLLTAWQPRTFVMENVPGLPVSFPRRFAEVCAALEGAGYVITAAIVPAESFGAATTRPRLIITGARADLGVVPGLPAPSHRGVTLRAALTPPPDPVIEAGPPGERIMRLVVLTEPGRKGEHALVARGGRQAYYNLQRAHNDRVCWTVPALADPGRCGILHPREHRFLSVGELMRVQGIPDEFTWPPTTTWKVAHHRIGNSVCPLVTRALGEHLLKEVPVGA
jgi:DNA (cytosine-5)-methyltransferase 1